MCMKTTRLPQLDDRTLFLTDGGIETTLIFHDGLDLPYFAAFILLRDLDGRETLRRYYARYLDLAREKRTGFVLESATWRASTDWAQKVGYSQTELDIANADAIALLKELRGEYADTVSPMVLSGCVGPRGDGYDPGTVMTTAEAEAYHAAQVRVFAESGVDQVTAITMTNVPEALGVVRASRAVGLPVAISFTVETDGSLPTGQSLRDAIREVDAETGAAPAYYMINCAHPVHFSHVLERHGGWASRIRGIRANASTASHAELDAAPDLDAGDPDDLGARYAAILQQFPHINVLGGCCGTDDRHVARICDAVLAQA